MNDKENNDKKFDWKKLFKTVGAIATVVAAAAPGTVEFIDDSEDYARQEAKQSGEQAQKSEEMTVLAYERLRMQLLYLAEKVETLEERDKENTTMLIQFLVDKIENPPRRHPAGRRPASIRTGGGVSSDTSFDLGDDPLSGFEMDESEEEGAEEYLEEEKPSIQAPMQQQLPVNLEKEWVKTKKK